METSANTQTQDAFIRYLRGDHGPLPPGPQTLPRDEVAAVHRARLVAGMAEAISEAGISGTTVADIVRRAQVSRRTFYEHFADKDACLLATYDACADLTMRYVEAAVAVREDRTWQQRMRAGLHAYLWIMAGLPGLARVFIVEMPSAGAEAVSRVRQVHTRFGDLMLALVEEHQADLPDDVTLDRPMANAIVGGVNELILFALAAGEDVNSPEVERTALRLLLGAMRAGAEADAIEPVPAFLPPVE